MSQLPLLFFPEATVAGRSNLGGRGRSFERPSAREQKLRLDQRFQQIATSFQGLQGTAHGLEPEQVLVMETIGDDVEGLSKAAAKIPGMEWLAEMDVEEMTPESGFADAKESAANLPCRLYAVMSNQQAMNQLLALWNNWTANPEKRADSGFGPFKNLFINLRDLRRWDARDRIRETGVLEYLQERLEDGTQQIRFEVELWCRRDAAARDRAYEMLSGIVRDRGGECIKQSAIPDIYYHGVLVKMPAAAVQQTVTEILNENYGPLIRCESVMFFRPFAQSVFPADVTNAPLSDYPPHFAARPQPTDPPLVALLDGFPLTHHGAIEGRLLLDDPDNLAASYAAGQQKHGTAMASLIAHGDLNEAGEAITSRVYVRPILGPAATLQGFAEVTDEDDLLPDLIHRAVRRLFEGDAPAAPSVKIVNLSIGDPYRPFDRELSPLARLLDWLAWKYRVLFLVSVGNHTDPLTMSVNIDEWRAFDAQEQTFETLYALHAEQSLRRPYSPAESVNALTIGAMHVDASTRPPGDRRVDLMPHGRLPSPIGSMASGFRRSVKPELFFPGGRQLYHAPIGANGQPASFSIASGSIAPGQLVACPGQAPLELQKTCHSCGTSNATAMASRLAAQVLERLELLRSEPGGDRLAHADLAVLAKCLIVHGAEWGAAASLVENAFNDIVSSQSATPRAATSEIYRLKYRLLGLGEAQPNRSLFCTDQRVSLLGWSTISCDEGHIYQLPLPPALSGSAVLRRIVGTLAWVSPVNCQHRNFRQARLWFEFPQGEVGVKRGELDTVTARRGTVEHRVCHGHRVAAFADGDSLKFTVSCKEDAGRLSESVPYAFAVSLEVAEPLETSIYEQVRDRVRLRIRGR